ncbi:MAG TPA: hypothetical protein VJ761_21665 [Ktedonobacteraceae bacterium]|nr:hypothetical protein [Ktedonobacteraceae bacterium]
MIKVVMAYVRMRRKARNVPGLLETTILIKPQRTVILVSLWKDAAAMADFATKVPEHALEVHSMWEARAEVWSGYFKLQGTSSKQNPWIMEPVQSPAPTPVVKS